MAISVTCPNCGKQLRAKDEHEGRRVKCPACQQLLVIRGEQATAHDVFISYSKRDRQIAQAVCARLEEKRIRCWIAPRDIAAGVTWAGAIINAIENSRVMVLIYSSGANESRQVHREVERAVAKGLAILPVRVEDVAMSKEMEYFLSASHWFDALTRPLEHHIQRLVPVVRSLITEKSADTPRGTALKSGEESQSKLASHRRPWATRSLVGVAVIAVAAMVGLIVNYLAGDSSEPPAALANLANEPNALEDPVGQQDATSATPPVEPSPEITSEQSSTDPVIERLLAKARANDSSEDGQTALDALDELLVKQPNHVEAAQLRVKVANYYRGPDGFTNGFGMRFVYIRPGKFMMGSPADEDGRKTHPFMGEDLHPVILTHGFMMAVTEVTRDQWQTVMETSPWMTSDLLHAPSLAATDVPATNIRWTEALEFCRRLSQREGRTYALPTEAQWEYACRAGTRTPFSCPIDDLTEYAWTQLNSSYGLRGEYALHTVASRRANPWGLFDMHGNASEFCRDPCGPYPAETRVNPVGFNATIDNRCLRGGCLENAPRYCRSAHRDVTSVMDQRGTRGFRVISEIAEKLSTTGRSNQTATAVLPDTGVAGSEALLANAKINDSRQNGAVALEALDQLLSVQPDHVEAARLRAKIAAYYPGPEPLTNEIGMKFVYVPPGEFTMGSPANEQGRSSHPLYTEQQHQVILTHGFMIGVTEVTRAQWRAVVESSPWMEGRSLERSTLEESDAPATNMRWTAALEFCRLLSEMDERVYRLPTAAQWEYACRAGSTTPFSCPTDDLFDYAWTSLNSRYGVDKVFAPHSVATRKPNAWGLFDMHGNAAEYCRDPCGPYPSDAVVNPRNASGPVDNRAVRGGNFFSSPQYCRSAARFNATLYTESETVGFRVVLETD